MCQVCNRILNLDPSDGLAFHCKMVAMLQTGKFDEALKQMEANKLELELSFEQAYAHYRLNNLDRSLAILDSLKVPQVGGQYNNNNYYYSVPLFVSIFPGLASNLQIFLNSF